MSKRIKGALFICYKSHIIGGNSVVAKGAVFFFEDVVEPDERLWVPLRQFICSDSFESHYYEPTPDPTTSDAEEKNG